jgi:predicted nucleic acid-binding protein
MGNLARTKLVRHPESAAAILAAYHRSLMLPVRLVAPEPAQTLELALSLDLTYYDAAYLQLSRELGLPLATFDAQLAAAKP